jgi:pyruvate/2-oxoglutarate dehydrogenase complex dihydrolipoamide dehydrogenase (E3) component
VLAPQRAALEAWLRNTENCTLYQDHARFVSSRVVRVGAEVLTAEQIFLDVGGRAAVPPIRGLDQVDYLTNVSVLDVDFPPPRLLIVGGSYIGLEFAQMYRRFGSEVTVVEMGPRPISHQDEDVSAAILDILENEGVRVRLNAKCIAVERQHDKIAVGLDCTDEPLQASAAHLLLAAGRRPNTDDLGLEQAGVLVDERGYIIVDEQLRTKVPGIWALGDAMAAGPSPTRPSMTLKPSPQIYSTMMRAASPTGSRPTRCTSIRRWDASARPRPRSENWADPH